MITNRELLARIEDAGPLCRDRTAEWFSHDLTTIRSCITQCLACRALRPCGELAARTHPRYGVWAGRVLDADARRALDRSEQQRISHRRRRAEMSAR